MDMTVLSQQRTFQSAGGYGVTLRRVRAQDRDQLVLFLQQLSPQTRQRRYMASGEWTVESLVREADRILRGQRDPDVCLIMTTQSAGEEEIVAVGELLCPEANSPWAEVAFLVRDDLQNRGIGSLLAERIAAIARARGITTLCVHTKAANVPMLHLARRLGHIASQAMQYGELQFNITPLAAGSIPQGA